MARRRGRNRNRGRRGRPNTFKMTIPFCTELGENKSVEITLKDIFIGATANTLEGVPWRLTKLVYSFANSAIMVRDTKEWPASEPAFMQISLHSAQTDNVEAVASRRHLSCNVRQTGRLFPRRPNPWKEDEDRTQALITVDNIIMGGSAQNTSLFVLMHVTIEFGTIPWSHPATRLRHNMPRPAMGVPPRLRHDSDLLDGASSPSIISAEDY